MNEHAGNLDVLLLAAGFGQRMRPLTLDIPKALLPIYGVPLLDNHIHRLLAPPGEVRRVVVNGHHLADQLQAHLERHPRRGQLVFSHEPEIMGTGGAIHWARSYLHSDPFLVVNADALFAAPLAAALALHGSGGHLITLILCPSPIRPNVVAEGDRVTALLDEPDDQIGLTFTGCQVVSLAAIDLLPDGSFHDIRQTYRDLIVQGRLGALVAPPTLPLIDVGTPASYLLAHEECQGAGTEDYGLSANLRAPVPAGYEVEGYGYVDPRAARGDGVRIRESVVLGDARIEDGAHVRRVIIGPGAVVSQSANDCLITRHGSRALMG